MAVEPMTLFARIADPVGVTRKLRELAPDVAIDGTGGDWQRAVVTFSDGGQRRTLTFTHDPEYYAEPNWSKQMSGMEGYFSRFPKSDSRGNALMLISSFRFSLGLIFDPEYDRAGDPRLEVLYEVAEMLDGVLFTPSGLRDRRGRVLFSADGEEEDPAAVWPQVRAVVTFPEDYVRQRREQSQSGVAPTDEELAAAPSAERVARRALALCAVTARAILEQGGVNIRPRSRSSWNPLQWFGLFAGEDSQRREVIEWLGLVGIEDELEPDEWEVVQRPYGQLEPGQQINSTWRLEGLAVLAWALGRFEMPPHDRLVECHVLWRSLGLLDAGAAKNLVAAPTLRPRAEIAALRARLFALHWRLRNQSINPGVIDFAEFARTCWFGPMDVSGLPLIDGDLALQGARLDQAADDAFSTAQSAALERHHAVNWLLEGPERYSEAHDDT